MRRVSEGDLAARLADAKLLIFDLDGTLADTSALHARAFEQVLGPLGVAVNYDSIAGLKTADALRRRLNGAGLTPSAAEIADLTRRKQDLARKLIARELAPLPGVDAFLRWARPGRRLAVCTSGSRGTVDISLRKLGYASWFDPVVCSDDVEHAKPHPEGYLRVLRLTGCAPGEALIFEDSDAGLDAAGRAGVAAVDVRPPFTFQVAAAL